MELHSHFYFKSINISPLLSLAAARSTLKHRKPCAENLMFTMLRLNLFLFRIMLAAVLNAAAQSDLPPKGWKWVSPCSASFLVPGKLDRQKSNAKPIDSCWATYGDGKLVVSV